jgi:hypothetical protein
MPGNRKAEIPKFLTGWKEIANYLGKGVRTVQRYEREMGLPVRRPAKKSRAAVVATKAELDAWVAASPFRDTFSLPRPMAEQAPLAADITRGAHEMRRLSRQMAELRNEVTRTVSLLKETMLIVQNEAGPNARARSGFSVADFDLNNKAVFDLVGTRIPGKAS